MLTLHANLDPVRRSLCLALGLFVACGKDDTTSDTGPTPGSSSSSGGVTPTSTGDGTTAVTGATTGTGSATGTGTTGVTTTDVGTTTTGGTTVETSGVSVTEGTTTGTTTGGTTAGESADSGTTGEEPMCKQLMQGGTDPPAPSGWEKCGDQLPHRVDQVACLVNETAQPCVMMDPENQCMSDAECVEMPFGSCHQFTSLLIVCGCVYGCETDEDCPAGQVCRCGGDELGPFTTCTPSGCADDGDCPMGEVCQFAQTYGEDCPFEVNSGHCTTPEDTCDSDLDCGVSGCLFDEGKWQCGNTICGRPFVVADRAVTAAARERDDWRAVVPCVAAPADLRARLAAHWTEIGLSEHASVASFARFILQLLAVGAPATLVAAAQQALADEVEHARVCFALASLYAGTGVGPGPLAQAGDVGAAGLAAITAAVIREACVGETLSALEVREAAARAEDTGLRRLLGNIANDEQRHAELGWRFVQWARAQMDADGRARAEVVFDEAIAEAEAQAARLEREAGTPALWAHGMVDAPLRAAVWRRGLAELVQPSARALATG